MGFHVETGVTGQGSVSLGGVVEVTEVAAGLVTPAELTTISGHTPHRRLHHQAWYGIGLNSPGGGPFTGIPLIIWHKFHSVENETHIFDTTDHKFVDTLYWDVEPGGEIFLEVDWV